MSSTFFEVQGISKRFEPVQALSNVSLSVEKGEVRALVGENGAGKSTLMKILNGNYKKDTGKIIIEGKEVDITSPVKAAEMGISIIFQELNLFNELTLAENIFVGRLKKKNGMVDWATVNKDAKKLLEAVGSTLEPTELVKNLSVANKQMVEIAKALSHNAKIILMDEPSATLTQNELKKLFDIIRDLKSKGITVIYISHRMDEIFEICDSCTVLRDGCVIDTKKIADVDENELVRMMVGREVESTFPARTTPIGEEILRVKNLKRRGEEPVVEFSLRQGEILGFSGLVGAGRTEIMRGLYAADYVDSAEVYIKGQKVNIRNPKDAKDAGIAFLTEDRKDEGLILSFPIKFNVEMTNLKSVLSKGFINKKKESDLAQGYKEKLDIKIHSVNQAASTLSGGNQQKVVLAKWLNTTADIIIMDEPTRGIDVGAKHEIYKLMFELIKQGKSIILISSEMLEITSLCDRVLVMKGGVIAAELTGDEITGDNIMKYAL